MSVHRKGKRGESTPVIVSAVVAAVGIAAILFKDFGPGSNSLGSGDGMITASALARAGAFALPTEPPVQLALQASMRCLAYERPLCHKNRTFGQRQP